MTEEVLFEFQDLKLTSDTMIMQFLDEETRIPLKEIASYHLKWYLHDPASAKRYWFLVLIVELADGSEKSGPIAVAEFSHADDEREFREDIEANIAEAIDLALSWHRAVPQKGTSIERKGIGPSLITGLN